MSNTLQKDQRGLVSFMITIIMMLVISLIVIGFTQVTNRNRREQLDRQLSAQAFYAAESGVNAAIAKINTYNGTPGGVVKQDTCSTDAYPADSTNLSTTPIVGYTCVLVNPFPPEITISANMQSSAVIPINPTDKDGVAKKAGSLTFTWSPASGVDVSTIDTTKCQQTTVFPQKTTATPYDCAFGLLRVDLYNVDYPGELNTDNLAGDTTTFFLQPLKSSGSSVTINKLNDPTQRGIIVGAAYDSTSHTYSATLNFNGSAQSEHYYARISTFYKDSSKVVVDGKLVTGAESYFVGAQATIDVTGKAQDVLRRVKVTVPLQSRDSTLIPQAAVQSTATVCKRFSTYTGYFSPVDGCTP